MPTTDSPQDWTGSIGTSGSRERGREDGILPSLLQLAGILAFVGTAIDFLAVCVAVFEAFGNSPLTLLGVIGAFAGAFETVVFGLLLFAAAAIVQCLRRVQDACEHNNVRG